jgi:hypothetical protein
VLYLLNGAAPFEAKGVTFGGIVLTYYVTGAVAGALVGLLSPLVHSRFGAMLVGWLAAFFVFVGIGLNMFGFFTMWRMIHWAFCAGMGFLFGVFGGNVVWSSPMKLE